MRYAPLAAALALALAATASTGLAAERAPAPAAVALLDEGRAALAKGDAQKATDAFEAALAVDPGYTPTLIELGRAAQAAGLPGKAIGLYREALLRDPRSYAAIAGEGAALAQKGALEKARGNLAKLESLCGPTCPEARTLAAAIAAGPAPRVAAVEPAAAPDAKPTASN